ncbi:MAG: Flp family type IVb pilin [Sulfitobacter sp.]
MTNLIQRFFKSEEGAVTVDWVVLTALVVGLAVAAFAGIDGGVSTLTAAIQTFLLGITVG